MKSLPPQALGKQSGLRATRFTLRRRKGSAQQRLCAEHWNQIGSDARSDHALRTIPAFDDPNVLRIACDSLQLPRLITNIAVIQPRGGSEARTLTGADIQ